VTAFPPDACSAAPVVQPDEDVLRHRRSFKLKGRKVEGGYVVKGALPWVSNLGADHYFGTIFEREDEPGGHRDVPRRCSDPAITLQPASRSWPMDGTGYLRRPVPRRLVPDELILAEQAGPFVKKIAPALCCCKPAWRSA